VEDAPIATISQSSRRFLKMVLPGRHAGATAIAKALGIGRASVYRVLE